MGQYLLQDPPTSRIDSAAALERVIEMKMSPEGSSSRAVEEEVALNWHYFLMAVEGMFLQRLIQLSLTFRSTVQYSHLTIDVTLMVYVVQSIGIQSQEICTHYILYRFCQVMSVDMTVRFHIRSLIQQVILNCWSDLICCP